MHLMIPILLLGLLSTLPADAKENGHSRGHGKPPAESQLNVDLNAGTARFSTDDINVILKWGETDSYEASPSAGALPPGLAKQLARNGHLPPGLQGRPLPPGLQKRLSPAPAGYDRIVVGRDVLLIQVATGVIADILRDVF